MTNEHSFSVRSLKEHNFVLGEYTTSAGPYAEDHFIAIAVKKNELFEFPVGSPKCKEIISYVQSNVDGDVQLGLSNSTDFRSNILYPKELSGTQFFSVQAEVPKKALTSLMRTLGIKGTKYVVSPVVTEYINRKN